MEENKFTKKQLKKSERFAEYIDIISAFLDDDKYYSIEEAEYIIKDFLGREEE